MGSRSKRKGNKNKNYPSHDQTRLMPYAEPRRDWKKIRASVIPFVTAILKMALKPDMQSGEHRKVIKKLLDATLWAWSEAMGKYGGNPLWSEGAVASFRDYRDDCWKSKSQRSQFVPKLSRIVHEHVVPRKLSVNKLLELSQEQVRENRIKSLFERNAIGAVVTRKEDERLRKWKPKTIDNGWDRYVRADIKFVAHNGLPRSLRRILKHNELLA